MTHLLTWCLNCVYLKYVKDTNNNMPGPEQMIIYIMVLSGPIGTFTGYRKGEDLSAQETE